MRTARTLPPAAAPIPWGNILRAFLSGFSSSRKPVAIFRNELKSYFSVKHCNLVSSGKAALTLILRTLHEISPERDEVLIPAFTCFSVPAAIMNAGLKIKLCDLDLKTLDFDKKKLREAALSEESRGKLLCVIPTHLFGIPADVEYCRETFGGNVAVIEDAAQAMATEWHGKKLGTLGDVGFFSLGRGKPLSTIEGGIIVTNRDDIGKALELKISSLPDYAAPEKVKLLAASFITTLFQYPSLFWFPRSLPFLRLGETIYQSDFKICKLSPIHAELANNWQSRLQSSRRTRQNNVRHFLNLEQNKFESKFSSCFNKEQSLIRLPALVNSKIIRDTITASAHKRGLGIMPSYPAPVNEIQELADAFFGEEYPIAKILSEQLLTIPTHEYIEDDDYKKICSFLSEEKLKYLAYCYLHVRN
jgi:dTDP-4-amino-4,6-dideoxygalactose transaminase